MVKFIKLIGNRKYKIINDKKKGLIIKLINKRIIFRNEFNNWLHMLNDLDKDSD
jgi:hypothetical protein